MTTPHDVLRLAEQPRGASVRRRLTIAIVLLVAGTVLISSVGSYLLIRRAAITTSENELDKQAQAVSKAITTGTLVTRANFANELAIIGSTGNFDGIRLVALNPDGTVTGALPTGMTTAQLDTPALLRGEQTAGATNHLTYTSIVTPIAGITDYTPVLVVTRKLPSPTGGVRYYVWVGIIAVIVATLVALALARRFTRPLVAAVVATDQIAAGDLSARVPSNRKDEREFRQLADAINAMGDDLARAREQERQFLLSVSHEFRTPLTSIRGYADAVVDGATDDPVAAATIISSESRRLERLVQDLLDLARLDADRFSLDLQRIDAREVVRHVVGGFRQQAHDLDLEIALADGAEVAASAEPLWIVADPDRLGQVIANLVENASTFAFRRITVGAGMVGPTPALWVVDDGPGIAAQDLERVFDRHYTSDRAGGRRKGSGLGLAIVSELVAAMGAMVQAESPVADGRGTRMVVWLQSAAGSNVTTESSAVDGAD